jgi:ELWxxDGT repeat protein
MMFIAGDGVHGRDLWITDGTEDGTSLAFDTHPGTADAVNDEEAAYNSAPLGESHLVFGTNDGLYVTDGTAENTNKLYDDNYVRIIGTLNGDVYYGSSKGDILKVSAATHEATVVKHKTNGGYVESYGDYILNGKLIFVAYWEDTGYEWWVTDGTEDGTHILKDINPNGDGRFSDGPGRILVSDDKFYFNASDGQHGVEAWVSDGTEDGTRMLADINPGTGPSYPTAFFKINNKVIFYASPVGGQPAFWTTDGTPEGTSKLFDFFESNTFVEIYSEYKGQLIFGASTSEGYKLYITDGTLDGTHLLKTFGDSADPRFYMYGGAVAYDKFFFVGNEEEHGKELWITDGTAEGTKVVDLTPGAGGTFSTIDWPPLVVKKDLVFLLSKLETWRTTGTTQFTEKFMDSPIMGFNIVGDQFYFFQRSLDYGAELFVMPFTKFEQDMLFEELVDKKEGDPDFQLVASTTSGLPVTFTASPEAKVSIEGTTLKILKPGTVTINAIQSGNGAFKETATGQTICINPKKPLLTVSHVNAGSTTLQSSSTEGTRWYLDSNSLPDQTASTANVTQDGIYTIDISIDGCVSEISDPLAVVIAGLEDEFTGAIYPNPAKDKLFIQWKGNSVSLSVVDTKGSTHYNGSFTNCTELNVSNLPAGFYILKLTTSGQQVIRKFIKE